MDSRSYYDGEQWWDEQGYEACRYDNQNYEEDQYSMSSYDSPYHYEEPRPMPPYNTSYYYEEPPLMLEYDAQHYYDDPNSPRASSMYHEQISYYRPDEDERQEREPEPSLAAILAGLVANQAQQQKDTQAIIQQLDELNAQTKMLGIQIAQQANLVLKEQEIEDEEEYKEPPSYVPKIPFPQRLKKRILEDRVKVIEENKRTLAKVDEEEEIKLSDYSCMKEFFNEEHGDSPHLPPSNHIVLFDEQVKCEDVAPHIDQGLNDFVDTSMNPLLEEFLKVDTSTKDYFEDWRPMECIGKLEESVPFKLETSFDDPFFPYLPQDKFTSFQPFISKQIDRSSHNPLILKGAICIKRLSLKRKDYCRLDGRVFKWDLNVD